MRYARYSSILRSIDSIIDILQINCDVVVDQEAGLAHVRANLFWETDFDGGVISRSTPADGREVFETASCPVEGCTTCTDVWSDDKIDLDRRSHYVEKSELLHFVAVNEVRESKDRLMLLPIRMYAYALQDRKWRAVCIDELFSPPEGGEDPFQDLVLDKTKKTLIKALVKNQIRRFEPPGKSKRSNGGGNHSFASMDIVPGKGRGLIVLLHGVPGVFPGPRPTFSCITDRLRCGKDKYRRMRGSITSTSTVP